MIEIRLVIEGNTPNHVHINLVDTTTIVDAIHQLGDTMAADLTALQAAVERTTTIEQSAIVLIQQIAAEVRNTVDPADLQALADDLDARATSLATAVSENTHGS